MSHERVSIKKCIACREPIGSALAGDESLCYTCSDGFMAWLALERRWNKATKAMFTPKISV